MIQEIIKKWDDNKINLEDYFRKTKQSEYETYLKLLLKVVELILNEGSEDGYNAEDITVIDNGDYQGTFIFIIPKDTYQPTISDYIVTHTYYGSCSGCDTLQSIHSYSNELPDEDQIKEYMTLCLHLIQKMKPLSE